MLFSPWVVAVSLIVGGFLILLIERIRPRPRIQTSRRCRCAPRSAIGCCQILAMIPGVSRAGATIMGALMLRVDRPAATEFSFFLAIPTMLAAAVYDLYKNRDDAVLRRARSSRSGLSWRSFARCSWCAGWSVSSAKHGFGVFAWYRIVVGAIALIGLWSLG